MNKREAVGVLVQAIEERDLLERTADGDGFCRDRTGATMGDTEAARLDALDAVAAVLGDWRDIPCALCGCALKRCTRPMRTGA